MCWHCKNTSFDFRYFLCEQKVFWSQSCHCGRCRSSSRRSHSGRWSHDRECRGLGANDQRSLHRCQGKTNAGHSLYIRGAHQSIYYMYFNDLLSGCGRNGLEQFWSSPQHESNREVAALQQRHDGSCWKWCKFGFSQSWCTLWKRYKTN